MADPAWVERKLAKYRDWFPTPAPTPQQGLEMVGRPELFERLTAARDTHNKSSVNIAGTFQAFKQARHQQLPARMKVAEQVAQFGIPIKQRDQLTTHLKNGLRHEARDTIQGLIGKDVHNYFQSKAHIAQLSDEIGKRSLSPAFTSDHMISYQK